MSIKSIRNGNGRNGAAMRAGQGSQPAWQAIVDLCKERSYHCYVVRMNDGTMIDDFVETNIVKDGGITLKTGGVLNDINETYIWRSGRRLGRAGGTCTWPLRTSRSWSKSLTGMRKVRRTAIASTLTPSKALDSCL